MEAGQHSQVLYSMFPFGEAPAAARPERSERAKPLIRFRFVAFCDLTILQCNKAHWSFITKDFVGELFIRG